MTARTPRVTPSFVVASAALLLALGSTSYAAGLARGSVGTPQLKNGAVTTAKVRDGAVTGAKVKDRSIGRSDLVPGVVPRATVVRRSLAVGESAELARAGGLTFEAFCSGSGAEGVVSTLRVRATTASAELNPVSGVFVTVRADQGFPVTTSPSGATDGFAQVDVLAFTPAAGTGRTTLTGSLRHLDAAPVTTDLATSAVGGAARRCDFSAVAAPTG